MPASYRVDERLGVFFLNCEDYLAADDLLSFVATRKSAAPHIHEMIVDLSAVTATDLTGRHIEGLARRRMHFARVAIVAPRPALFGLARMFQINAELAGHESDIRIFLNAGDALVWVTADSGAAAVA